MGAVIGIAAFIVLNVIVLVFIYGAGNRKKSVEK